jgi:transcriptional regulator with XRE-family HTH domain
MQTEHPGPTSRPFRARSAQDLGAAVKHYRTLAGMTQQELADRMGIHRSYLAALETGKVTEAMERVMNLLNELGVRVTLTNEER